MVAYLSDDQVKHLSATYPEIRDPGCVTCRGTRSYRWKGEEHPCDCVQQRELHTQYCLAGIGLRYQRLTWDDLEVPLPDAVSEWIAHRDSYVASGTGLLLTGTNGSGKTMLATLLLKELVRDGLDCYATTFASTIDALIASWHSDQERRDFAERFMRSRVLLLDDVGKGISNSFRDRVTPETLDHILRTRVQNERPTLLTTNLSVEEIRHGYGTSVFSLLVEQSIPVVLNSPDFRAESLQRRRREATVGETRPLS